jgi:hypothetical protein
MNLQNEKTNLNDPTDLIDPNNWNATRRFGKYKTL